MPLDQPHFFGYGSLVNRATHDYPRPRPASLLGWRRVWVHVASRPVAFLSVERATGSQILGLVAQVPGADWAALDAREYAYLRQPETTLVDDKPVPVQVYAVPADDHLPPTTANPLILSYIDAVVQGFLREFGPQGAAHFFATTHGWQAPVLNDRANPSYPRHQVLTAAERRVVDEGLAQAGARIMPSG
ncbi:gamma-glutamylcyclotransferase family protein [Pseudotabrizicola sp. L79]|uniref:gamma-glutamylcyclotransferase family protein n=1 Tax=Pseudotabrizicola sp. L79 TaxID=3118402 RepID=UPI002F94EC07